MLVLARREGQAIVIDKTIIITVEQIKGHRVNIGIEAPKENRIVRGELYIKEEKEK